MKSMQLKSNKELGQHFLKNQKTIARICQLPSPAINFILEVGPGPGTLTLPLIELGLPFYVIEKDLRTKEFLETILPSEHVFMEDATKVNFEAIGQKLNWTKKIGWLVSNLPYNVSSVLLRSFLECENFQYMTLMFQKEVGEKLVPKFSLNNSMRTLVQALYDVKLVEIVKPGAFHPPPKVDSIVLEFSPKPIPQILRSDLKLLEQFARPLFQSPRKQIMAKLKSLFPWPEADLTGLMQKVHIIPQDRAEKLTHDQVMALYSVYQSFEKRS
jgi:16S rRNA (adenine1518-N6/adenine1519-N6)-dimethyltransferase